MSAIVPGPGLDPRVLRESLRQAERTVASQLEATQTQVQSAEGLVRLAVAGLGGTVAVVGLIGGSLRGIPLLIAAGIALAVLAALIGLLHFVSVTILFRLPFRIAIALDLDRLTEWSRDPEWTMEEHLYSILAQYPTFVRHNASILHAVSTRKAIGVVFLVVWAASLLRSLGFIVGGSILV